MSAAQIHKEFNFRIDNGESQFSFADFLQSKVLNASDPAAEIQKLEPPFPGYRKLLALLPVYEEFAQKDDGQKLPATAKTVRPGQPYAGLPRLQRVLQLIGDIPAGAQLDANPTIYQGALVDGVKHYQSRHGENPTGCSMHGPSMNSTHPTPRGFDRSSSRWSVGAGFRVPLRSLRW